MTDTKLGPNEIGQKRRDIEEMEYTKSAGSTKAKGQPMQEYIKEKNK